MAVPSALFAALIDDASMFPPGNAAPGPAVRGHEEYRRAWFAPLIGPLVARAGDLPAVAAAGQDAVRSSVILSEPAVVTVPGVEVVAVEYRLRRNADLSRVLGEIDESVSLFVEFGEEPGWERAAAAVRDAGRFGKIRTGGPGRSDTPPATWVARRLQVFVDLGLPFKATAGLHHAWAAAGQHGFLNLLLAVDALLDGADASDAAALLDQNPAWPEWDDAAVARTRGALRSFGCCGVSDPVSDLVALGLVDGPR